MKTLEKDFEPFGPEWEKEMMKFNKKQLIEFTKTSLKKANKYDELIAIMDKFYETDNDGEFVNGGDLVDIGEAVAHKLGYL